MLKEYGLKGYEERPREETRVLVCKLDETNYSADHIKSQYREIEGYTYGYGEIKDSKERMRVLEKESEIPETVLM